MPVAEGILGIWGCCVERRSSYVLQSCSRRRVAILWKWKCQYQSRGHFGSGSPSDGGARGRGGVRMQESGGGVRKITGQ
ncbi:hypothetical protein BOTBODRAFT_234366 [Botryobasidium botryosum FD-172 SS1]|uniref:Uncharacterized protein n=1 Tax=Botryobasidium botryosum (strain FD-172 SS1) TaxID=930990 RepID=A0A067M4K0_BOTB1|nr:hypothetical protein BOTBODRAFT_234366 [Botryobasidium botryosum FD-172 SS1]